MLRNLRGAYFVMCRRRVSAASKVVGATLERSSAPPKTRRATPQRAKRDECTPQFENASLGLGVAWFRRTTKEQQKFCGELRASTGHMLEPVLMINHCFTSTSQKKSSTTLVHLWQRKSRTCSTVEVSGCAASAQLQTAFLVRLSVCTQLDSMPSACSARPGTHVECDCGPLQFEACTDQKDHLQQACVGGSGAKSEAMKSQLRVRADPQCSLEEVARHVAMPHIW